MDWQPIDYQGIINMDRSIVAQIANYLDQKETELAKAILTVAHILGPEAPALEPPKNLTEKLTLNEALDLFQKKIKDIQITHKQSSTLDWPPTIRKINEALWEYVEVLEGSAVELYQQLALIGFKEWKPKLTWTVDAIKDEFRRRMDLLLLAIHRLENILWQYKNETLEYSAWLKFLRQWLGAWGHLLDKELTRHIENSRRYLFDEHQKFMSRYNGYQALDTKTQESLNKFESYETFQDLEKSTQDKFRKIYQLLKIWEINQHEKAIPPQDIIISIHSIASIDAVKGIFIQYAKILDDFLFKSSRMIKLGIMSSTTPEIVLDKLDSQHAEVKTLGSTAEKYREFLLRTNPNPYVRSRWGFTETPVGPEPFASKEFQNLIFQIENLDRLYEKMSLEFAEAVISKEIDPLNHIRDEGQLLLHEMSQPLVSYKHIIKIADRLTDLLEQCHELGTNDLAVVDFVSDTLSKAMKADWRFQALQQNDKFHHIYDLHRRITGLHGDRLHIKRMNKFRHHFQQIEKWVKQGTLFAHTHEIETEINDIKVYLQDFFASLQRIEKEQATHSLRASRLIHQAQFELLEYLYLFHQFYLRISHYGLEGKLMRRPFLFADQYFEYIDSKISELSNAAPQQSPETPDE